MGQIGKAFLIGLATILPVALTLYLVYVMALSAERLMGDLLKLIVGEGFYWPGMGLILAGITITLVGFLIRVPGLQLLVNLNDAIMTRIPLVKTIYTTIRDFMDFMTIGNQGKKVGKPVSVKLWDEIEVIGLVTDEDLDEKRSLVYLPMSYQLGGYTLALDKNRLTQLDMSVQDALRYVVTAGIQRKS